MHHTHHFFHFFKNRELNELYLSISIKSFAIALIGIFVPIYLYKMGYPLPSIFLFYAIVSLTHLVFTIPSAKISTKFGIKHSILFSMPFLIFFLLLLYSLEQFSWPLPLLSIVFGVYSALFWVGYHTDFSKFSDKKKRGSQVGLTSIISSIFHVVGPVIGALILTAFSFQLLFIIVAFLLLISVAPLFFSKEVYEPMRFSLTGFFKKQRFRNIISFFGQGVEQGISFVVWPLFIFIFIFSEKYLSLGFVSSLTFLASMIFVLAIGKFADLHRKITLKIGSVGTGIVWVVKSFVITPIQVFIVDVFYGFSKSSMAISFDAISYDKANRLGILRFTILREITHHVGKIVIFAVLMFITDFASVFRFGGGIASLLRLFF